MVAAEVDCASINMDNVVDRRRDILEGASQKL